MKVRNQPKLRRVVKSVYSVNRKWQSKKKTNKEIRCLQCEPEVTIENNIRIQVSINTLFLINQRKIDTYQE
jgi:hypothetical protein